MLVSGVFVLTACLMKAIHNKRYLVPAISAGIDELMKGMRLNRGLSVEQVVSKTDHSYV